MSIRALSKKVAVITQPDGVDGIDVDETKIPHQKLIGAGKNTHAAIDDHLSSNLNPHSVRAEQTGAVPVTMRDKPGGFLGLDESGFISEACIPAGIARYEQVANHSNSNKNPHSVSTEQIGAVNKDEVGHADGVAPLDGASRVPKINLPKDVLYRSDLETHGSQGKNPHKVTAQQVGAIPVGEKGRPGGVAPIGLDGKLDPGLFSGVVVTIEEFKAHANNGLNPHKVDAFQIGAVPKSSVGIAGGVAPLNKDNCLPETYLPYSVATKKYVQSHADRGDNPHGVNTEHIGAVHKNSVGSSNGVAPLGNDGKLPDVHIPNSLVREEQLLGHVNNRDNPHGITPLQIGAVGVDGVGAPGGVARLDSSGLVPEDSIPQSILRVSSFKGHSEDISNPHRLSASSVGAVSVGDVGVTVAQLDGSGYILKEQVPDYLVTDEDFFVHVGDEYNPHKVKPEQVGCDKPLWNASKIHGHKIENRRPFNGQILRWAEEKECFEYDYESMVGEVNKAENLGSSGVCFYACKEKDVLKFRRIKPESNKLTARYSEDDDFVLFDVATVNIDHDEFKNVGRNSHSTIDSHLESTANPHKVTAKQVGNEEAVWNANQLLGRKLATSEPADKQVLRYDAGSSRWVPSNEAASEAESNTAVNVGKRGVGVFKRKKDAVLEFKRIASLSNKITIDDDEKNSRINVSLNEETIHHDKLSGAGKKTHSDIDVHLSDMGNPHKVKPSQVGNDKPEWNANKIQGVFVDTSVLEDNSVLVYNKSLNKFVTVNIRDLVLAIVEANY